MSALKPPPLLSLPGGHLTAANLKKVLEGTNPQLEAGRAVGLVVDARQMTGYDTGARDLFVEWHAQRRDRIRRVAVVTSNTLWHMVIRAMALAAGTPMKPFRDLDEASAWAGAVP